MKIVIPYLLLNLFLVMPVVAGERVASSGSVAGRVTLVIGQVVVIRQNGEEHAMVRGTSVSVGDRIKTAAGGHVHLRFIDDAAISIRPGSLLHIESYHYDRESPQNSAIRLKLEEGVMRSISGKATESAHDRFRLNTPITAIGVLGTDFVVKVDDENMWAAVFSGAIAVAPLQGDCVEDDLGSCPDAMLLSENMGSAMLEYRYRNNSFQLRVHDLDLLPQSVEGIISGDSQGSLSEQIASSVVSEQIASSVVDEIPGIIDEEQSVAPLAWARWSTIPWSGDSMSQTFWDAREGREVTVGLNNYALFRVVSTFPELIPDSGSYNFSMDEGQVHFVERVPSWVRPEITEGQIDRADLSVNFNSRQFATHLEMSHPEAGAATLDLDGAINNTGIFTARGSDGKTAGAFTLDGSQAGMLFERPVESGTFKGITSWSRQ